MALEVADHAGGWDLTLPAERARLVRLCAYLTGNSEAAEDLAQETLVEAWRHAHQPHDPSGRTQWLAAIARNACQRWSRRRGRELARHVYDPWMIALGYAVFKRVERRCKARGTLGLH